MVYNVPLFSIVLLTYPLFALILWKIIANKKKLYQYIRTEKNFEFRAIDITIEHSILLIIAIVSFLLVHQITYSWGVILELYDNISRYMINQTLIKLKLLIGVICIMLIKSYIGYKTRGIEYFSIILHGLGLMGTLICYINMISSKVNLTNYSNQIIWCEGICVEAMLIASLFLVRCNSIRNQKKIKWGIE